MTQKRKRYCSQFQFKFARARRQFFTFNFSVRVLSLLARPHYIGNCFWFIRYTLFPTLSKLTHDIQLSLFWEQQFYAERKNLSKDVGECVHCTYLCSHDSHAPTLRLVLRLHWSVTKIELFEKAFQIRGIWKRRLFVFVQKENIWKRGFSKTKASR